MATAIVLGALTVGLLNPLVAATGSLYDDAVAEIDRAGSQTVSLGDSAVWLRQAVQQGGEEAGQIVIRASRASPDAVTLYDASFLVFGAEAGPIRRIEAREARLTPGAWDLRDVSDFPLDQPNPQAAVTRSAAMTLASDLTAQRIREGSVVPNRCRSGSCRSSSPGWNARAFPPPGTRSGSRPNWHARS